MTETRKSICGICSGQCPVELTIEDGIVTRVRPVTDRDFAGAGPLCIRGAVGADYVNHPDRLKTPMRRTGAKGLGRFEPISWDEAQPGDLVFYPDDEHVGIVGGRDESGNMLIIHCAFSQNNVVITGLEGFTSIGKPVYYNKSY